MRTEVAEEVETANDGDMVVLDLAKIGMAGVGNGMTISEGRIEALVTSSEDTVLALTISPVLPILTR